MSSISNLLKNEPLHNEFTSVKGFFFLSLPLILLSSSQSIAGAVSGLFLAHYSTSALQAHAIGSALIAFFQSACIRMASEAQIFVSQADSSNNEKQVGVYVWQMIWLSLLSMLVTFPLGIFVSNLYFDHSTVQQEAKEYFQLFMYANFLFPLSMALNSFYTGRGKQKILLIATAGYIVMQVFLAKNLIGHFGLKGAAFSHILTQLIYCSILFAVILNKQNRRRFGTDQWRIQIRPLLASVKVGAFNGMSSALMSLSWTVIVKIVANKGTDYLTIVAFGNNCAVFLAFLNLGIGQALSIKASALIGKKQLHAIWDLVRTASFIVLTILSILFPFLVLFPDYVLNFFFPEFKSRFSPELCDMLRLSCRFLWLFELVGGIDRITRGLLTAIGDTVYMFFNYIVLLSLGCCLPIYLAISVCNFLPSSFWGIMTLTIFVRNIPLFFRLKKELLKLRNPQLQN